jgi:glycosyltransferase involved in cell wall biosynthesis
VHAQPRREPGVRLAILDDNPFVRLPNGDIRPRAALFHRFAEAVVARGGLGAADYLIPVADLAAGEPEPPLRPIDPTHLRVVPTAPFRGIAGYLRRAPILGARNWRVIRRTVNGADLVWIKTPASNAILAAVAARGSHVPFFSWVAGSARAVVGGQDRPPASRFAAAVAAFAYDGISDALAAAGPSVRLDAQLFTSVVSTGELAVAARVRELPAKGEPFRLVWAGRVVPDKGLDVLLAAVQRLDGGGLPVSLEIVGDGAGRGALEAQARAASIDGIVRWSGYVGDRDEYLGHLRDADLFVLPSRAEGIPKVLVEAMASGLPIVATRVGQVAQLLPDGHRGQLVEPDDPAALARAIRSLAADPGARLRLATEGLDFARDHTMEAQADRLLAWLRTTFPRLPWPAGEAT